MKTHGLIHALLAIGLLQLSRLGLVSTLNCSYGKDENRVIENGLIPVTHGQVLNLRQGETFIFDCVGQPQHHQSLTLQYNEESCHAETNTTTLEYTWYCVIDSDGPLNVWGFDRIRGNTIDPLITINIKSYDLTNSHITTEHTTSSSTTASSVGDGKVDQNLQNQSSTEKEPIANASNFYLMGAVVVLGVVVMALFITILLMAVKIHRLKNNPVSVEDGKSGYTEEDHAMQTRRNSSGTDQMQSTAHDVESDDQAAHSTAQGDADQVDVDVQSKAHVESDDQAHSTAQSHTDRETEEETHSSAHDHADQVDVDSDDSILDNSTTKIKV